MNITVSSILNIPLVVLLLFLLASCQPDGPAKDSTAAPDLNRGPSTEVLTIDQPFIRRYAGLIDRSPVTLVLVNWGDGRIGGWLKQGQEGKRKSLDGEVSLDESFLLEIFDEMSFEGRLRGSIAKVDDLQGQWSNPDSSEVKPFSVQLLPMQEDRFGWRGIWHLNDTWDEGTLLIGDVQRETFTMALEIYRNGHYGYMEEVVPYQNTKATFDSPLFTEGENCQLVMGRQSHQVQIYQPTSPASCGFGARASATGGYERQKKEVTAAMTYGDDRSHFSSKKIHDEFRNLVGKKMYDQFAFNMQKYVRENKSLLAPGREVKSVKGWIAGLMTLNEAIILYDEQGHFWAAILDPVNETNSRVLYFTNDAAMKEKLPVAIEQWRERFSEYPVIYD